MGGVVVHMGGGNGKREGMVGGVMGRPGGGKGARG